MSVTWSIAIDLDDDDVFETDIAEYAVSFNCNRGRKHLLNSSADGFEPMPVGEAVIELDNHDGRFDAYNASSPYYPNMEPGKLIQITCYETTDTVYDVFAGVIEDIQLTGGYLDGMARMTVRDGMHFLMTTPSSHELELSKQISAAVTDILTDIEYPDALGTDINKSSDYVNYYWSKDRSAAATIHELAELELGQYFCAGDGKFTFYGRHGHKSSTVTLSQANLLKDISRPRPWEVNKNLIRVLVHQVNVTAGVDVFTLGIPLYVDAGSTDVEMWADFSYSGSEAFAEDVTVSFSANSNSDSTSGTDMTTDFSVTVTEFSNVAKLDIANNGSSGGYVTITLSGTAYIQANEFYVEDGTGKRMFTLDSDFVQDKLKADEHGEFLLEKLNTQTTVPVISIEANPSVQFGFELQDVVTVDIPLFNINSVEYRVGGIDHSWVSPNGQASVTTVYMEPFLDPGDADTLCMTLPFDLSF